MSSTAYYLQIYLEKAKLALSKKKKRVPNWGRHVKHTDYLPIHSRYLSIYKSVPVDVCYFRYSFVATGIAVVRAIVFLYQIDDTIYGHVVDLIVLEVSLLRSKTMYNISIINETSKSEFKLFKRIENRLHHFHVFMKPAIFTLNIPVSKYRGCLRTSFN